MAACCSPARAKAKRIAIKKANYNAAHGITPKKAHGKKAHAKKASAKKAKPCRMCGKGK